MNLKKKKVISLTLGILFLMTSTAFGAAADTNVVIYAGNNTKGTLDGNLLESGFSAPYGLSLDNEGGLIVADSNNSLIRKLGNGKTATIGGFTDALDEYSFPAGGYVDGDILKAKINKPRFTAVGAEGIIYISDTGNNSIRKIAKGTMKTVAGNGKAGYKNGKATEASFNCPSGIALDAKGNIYVADSLNNVIREINTQGIVSTFAGVNSENGGYKDGGLETAMFNEPSDIAFDKNGALFVLDTGNQLVRKIENGKVTTYCGKYSTPEKGSSYAAGGFQDGYGIDGAFNFPKGLDITTDGILLIADSWNNAIRAVLPNKKVITIAGTGIAGDVDGERSLAQFNSPVDVKYNDGKLYISDMWNNSIKVMTLDITNLTPITMENDVTKGIQFEAASKSLQLAMSGKVYKLGEKNYFRKNDSTWVSIPELAKAWGAKVSFDKKKNVLTLTKDKKIYKIKTNTNLVVLKAGVPMQEIRTLSDYLGLKTYGVPDNNGFVLY